MKNDDHKKHERAWNRTVRLADKRGGILFNEGIRISQKEQFCVLKPNKKKVVLRITIGVLILILFYLGLKYLPENDRWDEFRGFFIFYGFFVFIALPSIILQLFRQSKLVIDSLNVVISYWDLGRYRRLVLPIEELSLKLSFNEHPKRERKIPSGYPILSLIHNSHKPKDIIITSAKEVKEITQIFEVLKRFFDDEQISFYESESTDSIISEDKSCDIPDILQELSGKEREPLNSRHINCLFPHHTYVKTYDPYGHHNHLIALVWKWRIRAWLGYFLGISISSLSVIFIIICLVNFGFSAGVVFLMFVFTVSLFPTMYGTVEVLSRYVIMDKLNNSLTYHPWFQSQWSKAVCQLSAIKALQLCLSFENVEIDGERCPSPNYQLNIITISEDTIKRHNLSTSNNEQTIREQAEQFSSFLNVPILHHTDYLPKQYKDIPSFIRYIVGQMRKKKEDDQHGI